MESVTWVGVALALVAMVRGEWSAMTARQVARDKLLLDADVAKLKADHAHCTAHADLVNAALAKCEEKHDALETKMAASERDRADLRGQLTVLRAMMLPPHPTQPTYPNQPR